MKKSIYSDKALKLQEALADARKRAGLTQAELAAKLGKPQSLVSYYENGGRRLDVLEYIEICDTLGINASRLLQEIDSNLSRNTPFGLRYIDENDIIKNPETVCDYHFRIYGQSLLTPAMIKRLIGPGNKGLYVGLAEEAKNKNSALPYTIRAHATLWFFNKKNYEAKLNGTPAADLEPWKTSDGDAYGFLAFATSQVRNGLTFLLADLLAALPAHPAYSKLQELFWIVGNPKGEALTKLVGAAQIANKHFTYPMPSGEKVKLPYYHMPFRTSLLTGGEVMDFTGVAERIIEKKNRSKKNGK